MHQLMMTSPHSTLEPVTDVFHGVPVTDPYRWFQEQDSRRARAWIAEQSRLKGLTDRITFLCDQLQLPQ